MAVQHYPGSSAIGCCAGGMKKVLFIMVRCAFRVQSVLEVERAVALEDQVENHCLFYQC
jgi:hypothetical protein